MEDKAYYEGGEILTDQDFDSQEQPEYVGYEGKFETTHLTRMGSLKKVQVRSEEIPVGKIFDSYGHKIGILGWKLDGLAINVTLEDGKLVSIVTRGNGLAGIDVTSRLKDRWNQVSKGYGGTYEIRCEAVMSWENFKLFSEEYAHPRNLVSGIVNSKGEDSRLEYVDLVPIEVIEDGKVKDLLGGMVVYLHNFSEIFKEMIDSREKYIYPVDGLVIRRAERVYFELDGKYPKHAMAIKMPPPGTEATIREIEWKLTKTGKYTPICHLHPVEIDGRIIKRTHGYNFGFVMKNGLGPGAKVAMVISGDIIPQIIRCIEPGEECTVPEDSYISSVELLAGNMEQRIKAMKFNSAMGSFGFKGIGSAIWKIVGAHVDYEWVKVFSGINFSEFLTNHAGKLLNEYVGSVKEISLSHAIRCFQINNVGKSISIQVARKFSGLPHDYSGLERAAVEEAEKASEEFLKLELPFKIAPEVERSVALKYCMTGSPKEFGFSTKKAFTLNLPADWIETGNVKEANILFTDSLNSNSSKINAAKSLGIEIKLYSEYNLSITK